MTEPNWLQRFVENPVVRQLRELMSRQVPHAIWWEVEGPRPKALDYSVACRTCHFVRASTKNRAQCERRFLESLEQSRQSREPVQFVCPIQRYAFCIPLEQNGQPRGYLAMCYSEQAVPQTQLQLAAATLKAAVRETERSDELKLLSDTIQPRCVALSTIHTIHRLISSTLNLEELLPRVARLCCQVLRAKACTIWLLDREKKALEPRAVVELKKKRVGGATRPCRVGVGVPGRVAFTCKAYWTQRMMVVPLVEEECIGVILVRRTEPSRPFTTLDQEILTTLAEQAVVAIRNAQMYETQERVTWGTIRSLSAILDGMDTYSSGTVSRPKIMAEVALKIAREMKVPSAQQKSLHYAALLHDAGRLGIPQEILRKPAKLEPAEFDKVKQHTVRGASFLEPLEILEPAVPIVLYHHERYDGTGYPRGLKKEAIPLGARILAVANAFEAMICDRPYRHAMSVSEAAGEIASHAGTQFDPKVVEAFMSLVRRGQLNIQREKVKDVGP